MLIEVYDSLLDPAQWPSETERARLRVAYAWEDDASEALEARSGRYP